MTDDSLSAILAAAQHHRDAGQWAKAVRLFRRAEEVAPGSAEIKHNLALACFGGGDPAAALVLANAAARIAPSLWQSHALRARIHRAAGSASAAEAAWGDVLAASPYNGTALLGLADLALNEFGDAAAAIGLATSAGDQTRFAVDAELTVLMASLYTGGLDARQLSDRLINFARTHLQLPRLSVREPRAGRRRIALISPLFSASPVYFFAASTIRVLADSHHLVFFNRGTREDWATALLRESAREWIEVANLDAATLSMRIAAAEIDVLIDLGGWSDAVGLAALSSKPAARMYKWVGGQSATTGLDVFDGWIGDDWQSPVDLQPLYAEPLVSIAGGYVDYTPPPFMSRIVRGDQQGVALVGNPVKITPDTVAAWPSGVDRVVLIDRRYAHARTLERVTDLLAQARIAVERVVVPVGQENYLRELACCAAIVNTRPYAAGLTAVEASVLGVRLLTTTEAGPGARDLFCQRHHLSHQRTGGANKALAAQMLSLVAR